MKSLQEKRMIHTKLKSIFENLIIFSSSNFLFVPVLIRFN